jgi:hypothetical protein
MRAPLPKALTAAGDDGEALQKCQAGAMTLPVSTCGPLGDHHVCILAVLLKCALSALLKCSLAALLLQK